jgi:hypothetical protein
MLASLDASNNSSFIQRHSPDPPASPVHCTEFPKEETFGKVSFMKSDGSVFTTGVIIPVGQITRYFGRITSKPVLKIKSASDGKIYTQEDWVTKYGPQVSRNSVYASDPTAAAAYAQNFQKMVNAPRAPRTPRPSAPAPPVRRTVFGMLQPPPSLYTMPLNLTPLPFKFDLPPLPRLN